MESQDLERDWQIGPPAVSHNTVESQEPEQEQEAPTAAHQVLHLPELLELILLYLPQKDLLLSQRVCRSFRYTIEGSLRLQRALFFSPNWNLEGRAFDAYSANNRPGQKPENNRLLRRAFLGCYPTVTLVIVNDSPTPHESAIGRRGSERWSWDVCISFPADKKLPDCKPSVLYPEASWRRMFLSQPPCQNLHLVRRWQRNSKPALVRDNGITMGDFYQACTGTTKECWHESYISSDRDWHFEGNIKNSSVEE
jgi:hypothetical protein